MLLRSTILPPGGLPQLRTGNNTLTLSSVLIVKERLSVQGKQTLSGCNPVHSA
jgi:hypothetical protein